MLSSPSATRGTGNTRRSRLLLFAALYFAQGVPWGFFTFAQQLRLTTLGLSIAALGGVVALTWLPWAVKPLLGLVVDRVDLGRLGRRRPVVLFGQAGMAITLLILAAVDPARSLGWFAGLMFVNNLFVATEDVGVDALALDLLPAGERGRANGLMAAGKYAGWVAGGPGLGWLGEHAGWPVAFAVASALLLPPAVLAWGVREAAPSREAPLARGAPLADDRSRPASSPPGSWLLLPRSFSRPVALLALAFALVSDSSDSLTFPLSYPLFQRQLGYGGAALRSLSILGGIAGLSGSLVGGALADRLGRRRALAIACLAVAVTDWLFAAGGGPVPSASLWASFPFVLATSLAGAMASGCAFTSAAALYMDLTNPRLAATQFQLFMAAWSLRNGVASFVGGRLADRFAPVTLFAIAGIVEVLPLLLLPLLDARRAQADYAKLAGPGTGPGGPGGVTGTSGTAARYPG